MLGTAYGGADTRTLIVPQSATARSDMYHNLTGTWRRCSPPLALESTTHPGATLWGDGAILPERVPCVVRNGAGLPVLGRADLFECDP